MKQRKTVVRVVRISKELDNILRNDAESNGTTVSAIISRALAKYAEWDRLADRIGFISFAGSFMRDIVEYVPDEDLRKIVQQAGNWLRELTMFWFKEANFDTLLATIKLLTKYTRVSECEIHADGRYYVMNLHHEPSRKLSIVISTLFEEAMNELGIRPTFEIGDNFLNVSFTYDRKTSVNV